LVLWCRGVLNRPVNGGAYSRKRYRISPPLRHSREGSVIGYGWTPKWGLTQRQALILLQCITHIDEGITGRNGIK
jgi:hypothetical protein